MAEARVIIEKAEGSEKYEWKMIGKNGKVVCVSWQLFLRKRYAVLSVRSFCKKINKTKELKGVIVEKAERFEKYEWKFVEKNNWIVCVSKNLYLERNQALKASKDFCKLMNKITDLELVSI